MNVNKSILEGMILENAFNEILNEGYLINYLAKNINLKMVNL